MQGVLNLNHFCEQHGPQLLLSTQAFHQPVTAAHAGCEAGAVLASSSSSSSSHCGACGWAAGASSLHSHDSETSTTYISRHYPQRPEVFSLVRRACVRSLSSELCPGRDGPLLFGDGHHGCTLSFNFALTDVQARGGLRHYSLTLVMADSLQLISAWPFLVRHMAVLVKDLKARTKAAARSDSKIGTLSPASPMVATIRRSGVKSRSHQMLSLPQLAGHPDLYVDIHGYFAWLLKAAAGRLFERVLEGHSLLGPSLPLHDDGDAAGASQEAADQESLTPPATQGQKFDALTPNDIAQTLSELQEALGQDTFGHLVTLLSCGDQVIVQGGKKNASAQVIAALSQLLPARCITMQLNQEQIRAPHECNLLSLDAQCSSSGGSSFLVTELLNTTKNEADSDSESTYLTPTSSSSRNSTAFALEEGLTKPHLALSSSGPLIGLSAPPAAAKGQSKAVSAEEQALTAAVARRVIVSIHMHASPSTGPDTERPPTAASQLQTCSSKTYAATFLDGPPPPFNTFAREVAQFLLRARSGPVMQQWLVCLRERWMQLAKMHFRYTRTLPGAEVESRQSTFVQAMGLQVTDLPVLRFWAQGLSRGHRLKLLLPAPAPLELEDF